MKVLVQKYGGSSVETEEKRQKVVEKIIGAKDAGYEVVVVVSAIGRAGAPYATDTLQDYAWQRGKHIPARELDLLLSCGEIISGVILTGLLNSLGHPSVFLTGPQAGIITDNCFNEARIIRVEPSKVVKELQSGQIVIVAGFQGAAEDGEITTLGRGGSDTTAAALGVALNAELVEIYTDVDGIKTADPHIVSEAKTLEHVTYNEICQLAYEGAKVIHPRAVEIARQKNLPVRVKCTFNDEPGTLVTNRGPTLEIKGAILNERSITGITQISGIVQIRIPLLPPAGQNASQVFSKLAEAKISVDFINIQPGVLLFTVKDEMAGKARTILEELGLEISIRPDVAKVAVVGAGMTGVPGIMARIVQALTGENIKILQSSDSYTTIWCLVDRSQMEAAVKALHDQFKLAE